MLNLRERPEIVKNPTLRCPTCGTMLTLTGSRLVCWGGINPHCGFIRKVEYVPMRHFHGLLACMSGTAIVDMLERGRCTTEQAEAAHDALEARGIEAQTEAYDYRKEYPKKYNREWSDLS